jgi:predicted nucleotidyltransferase
MTALERALVTAVRRLEELEIPYMLIGGLANAVWGEPRATLDVDITVWVPEDMIAGLVNKFEPELRPMISDPASFIRETRVLPLVSDENIRVDLIFGLVQLEQDAIDRAVTVTVAGLQLRCCTAEDLILMKIISDRPQDQFDARGIALRRIRELDLDYLEPRIQELARGLERPRILQNWLAWKNEAGETLP